MPVRPKKRRAVRDETVPRVPVKVVPPLPVPGIAPLIEDTLIVVKLPRPAAMPSVEMELMFVSPNAMIPKPVPIWSSSTWRDETKPRTEEIL